METIKYVDSATYSIRNFYEKTKYQKVSELLLVLNSTFDEKLRQIKVFENKYSQIENTKATFLASLMKIIVSNVEDKLTEVFEKFIDFLELLEEDPSSFFMLEFLAQDVESVRSLIREFSKFDNLSYLYKQFNSSLKETMRRQNKFLIKKISVKICFKTPNIRLLEAYKKILMVLLHYLLVLFVFV